MPVRLLAEVAGSELLETALEQSHSSMDNARFNLSVLALVEDFQGTSGVRISIKNLDEQLVMDKPLQMPGLSLGIVKGYKCIGHSASLPDKDEWSAL